MKKILLSLICIINIACSQKDTTAEKTKEANKTLDKNTIFSFDINNIKNGCDYDSDLICTINNSIKCTINPHFEECNKLKDILPSFVFIQDDTLQRPTFQSYKITKLVPRNDGHVEVHTQSSCNGNWFGLCNGNIVYVMKNLDSKWYIKDMYALEL